MPLYVLLLNPCTNRAVRSRNSGFKAPQPGSRCHRHLCQQPSRSGQSEVTSASTAAHGSRFSHQRRSLDLDPHPSPIYTQSGQERLLADLPGSYSIVEAAAGWWTDRSRGQAEPSHHCAILEERVVVTTTGRHLTTGMIAIAKCKAWSIRHELSVSGRQLSMPIARSRWAAAASLWQHCVAKFAGSVQLRENYSSEHDLLELTTTFFSMAN